MSTLLYNNFTSKPQPHNQLMYLIMNHPLFQSKGIQFRQLFPTQLKPDHLIKLGTLFWTFMLPQFPSVQHKRLAIQMLQCLQLDQNSNSKITFTNLVEYLAKICQYSLVNIDVKNSVGFLQLLKSRITDIYIINSKTNTKNKVHYHFKLQLLDGQTIINQGQIPQQHHRLISRDIYYQQKTNFDQQVLNNIKQYQVIVRQLKQKAEYIIPYGYICEDFLSELINSDFQMKNSYKLKKNRKVNYNDDKIQYWISQNQTVNNIIRDQVVNQQIFHITGVLSSLHLPQSPIPNSKLKYTISTINRTYSHQNYFQKLKHLKTDQIKYFNILSDFFQRDQFNIDEITLTREKLIARRKQHLLGIQGKQTIKKQQKNYQDQSRALPLKIVQNLMVLHDQTKMDICIKQLTQYLKPKLEQGKNINSIIENNLSQYSQLPSDSNNPFMEDIINLAKKQPLQLLILGRPKCGKSTLARSVAKKYNLIYISLQSMITNVFDRVKFFQQNPPQTDQDGNIIGGLTTIQKCIIQDLSQGKTVNDQDVLDLINLQLQKPITQCKGFILDLPFQYNNYWIQTLISNRIYLPKINCRFFTHIIQIEQNQEQWRNFINGIMQKPEDLTVSSKYDRYLLVKPKPPVEQGQQQAQQQQNQQEKPQPLKQQNLIQIKCKQSLFSLIQHLSQHIHPRRYLKIQNSYQNIQQCLNLLQSSLYVIPLPKKIQGAQKQLLTVGFDQNKLVRKWSPWGLVDPVELINDKLIMGKFQFACEYAGRVFVFENQNNLNTFLNLPRKYIQKLPELPKKTNICITGPRKSGKKTLAKMISEIYKLQIINFEQILQRIILKQKSWQSHIASNPEQRSTSVHLSEGQFKQFSKGNLLNAKDILPIVLYHLGVKLQKKPVGWGVQKQQNTENAQTQQKKPAPSKKKKKDTKNQQDQRPKTPPIQDLSLKQIIPQLNHFNKLNQIKGFILLNFPNNQQQLNSLKLFNIPIDKMLILSDSNQQAPNKILSTRLNDAQLQQVALFSTAIGPVKQALTQQICKQIQIDGTPQKILNKVRQIIDPFYLKTDDDAINRVLADKQQESDPVPMGYCGEYCPVVLKERWLVKGKEEFQSGVQGKRFRICGQKQFAMFKQNPQLYLDKSTTIVPPRVMFMGLRGVGLKTQLLKFNQKYKIPILNLKQTLLQQIQAQKLKRKQDRYYKRGFKRPQFDEQGKQIQDEQLNQQSPDFDKRAKQIEIAKKIFEGIDQIFINGNFFDIDEEKISTNLVELLTEARRLPEVVYILKSQQSKWLARNLNKAAIEKELEEEIQKIRAQKRQAIQKARQAAIQAGQQFNPPAEQQQQLPKLQQKIAAKQQSLKAQRQADAGILDGFIESFRALNIQVIQINCERQVKHVTDKINHSLQNYIEDRINKWQRNNMLPIERHRVPDFLNNFIAQDSRFGKVNPFTLTKNVYSFPLIYNERIYYLKDEQQRDAVMKNTRILTQNKPVPLDILTVPKVFMIGKPKSGKTTLSQTLCQKLGLVYISFNQIVSTFTIQHQEIQISQILTQLKQGKTLMDDQLVRLIQKRISLADCKKNGWILDGMPMNKNQAELMNRKNIFPTAVFLLALKQLDIKKRVMKNNSNLYDYDMQVVHERISKNRRNIAEVQIFYEMKYNNLTVLDANLSKWGLFETAKKVIDKKIKAKKQFTRALALYQASAVSDVGINFNCVINNISDYQNYCPISYKLKRQYIRKCIKHHENLALYNRKIYVFNTTKQLNDFIENPETYINKGPNFNPPKQVQFEDFKFLLEKGQNKGYCMVQLLRKKLVKGNFLYGLIYKGKYFLTANPRNMKLLIKNPALYEMVKLPDKLPVEFEKKNQLKKIAKRNDCTAFLEHHLSNILMRSLAQLGYRRPKYPTLSSKQSALKFLALSLKATNPNKDEQYRQKYSEQLNKFIKQSNYSQQIRSQMQRKQKGKWQQYDEQNLLKLCEQYNTFMKQLQSEDKIKYFSKFIR